MDIEKLVEKTVLDYCKMKGYDEKLTSKLSQIVKRYRKGSVEISDLGTFLKQIEELI